MEQNPENLNNQLYVIQQELRKLQKQNAYRYQQIRKTGKQLNDLLAESLARI